MNASLFVLLFVLLLFFSFNFFWGAGGWGWVCFVCVFFLGGGGWNTTQLDVNVIHRTSECYSWQRKFDRRWFVCFVFCLFFFGFYFIFIIFSGEGVG